MATNTLLTLTDITNEAAMVLENQVKFPNAFNRQYESRFAATGKKSGDTINVRKPPRYKGRRGEQASVEASTETYVPLTLAPLFGCDIQFSTTDLTLSIDEFSDRFVKPQVATVANMIDVYCADIYKTVWNQIGTPGTDPNTQALALGLLLGAQQKLSENAAPVDGNRSLIVGPQLQANLIAGMAGLFNPSGTVSKHFKTGAMGDDVLGFNIAMDQNIARHTSGSTLNPATTGTLSANVATGASTLAITGHTANAVLNVGDIIRITGYYGVNPQSRVAWGTGADQRASFVVTEQITLSGAGAGTVKIAPTIYGPEDPQRQNVSALPLSGAVTTVISVGATAGSASQALAFHKDAFVFASVDLELPGGGEEAHRVNKSGIACRMWRGYNINANSMICRFDVLAGVAAVYPELAVRVVGA